MNMKIFISFVFMAVFLFSSIPAMSQQNQPILINDKKEETPAEFVERNLAQTRKRLANAKDRYQKCCGSVDLYLQSLDPETIRNVLPKPHRLRFTIRAPEKKIIEVKSAERDWPMSLQFYPGWLTLYLEDVGMDFQGNYMATMAADDLTSAILKLRRTVPISVLSGVTILSSTSEVKECCLEFNIRKNSDGSYAGASCSRTAKEKVFSFHEIDPRTLQERLGFSLDVSEGGNILGKGSAIQFNSPGWASITSFFRSNYKPNDFKPLDEQICQTIDYTTEQLPGDGPPRYRLNVKYIPADERWGSLYRGKVIGDWVIPSNLGKLEKKVKVDVIGFSGVRINGLDYRESGKEGDSYDLFARDKAEFKNFAFIEKEPYLILRRGDGESIEPASKWMVNVSYHVIDGGPFAISQQGEVRHLGGVGEARIRMDLGRHWSLIRKLTANRWTVDMDRSLADGNIAPGVKYRLAIIIQGPADMTKYRLKWSGGNWQSSQTGFVRQGQGWVAENFVTIPFNIKLDGSVELAVTAYTDEQGETSNPISWKRFFRIVPAIASIDLRLAAKGQEPTKDTIDLFFPNYLPDGNRFMVVPIYKSTAGDLLEPDAVRRFLTFANLRLNSDSSAVAQVDSGGGQVGHAVGEAWITAELGGVELDDRGQLETLENKMVVSNPVKVSANQLILSRSEPQGGFTSYTLRVIGPASMEKYQALFHFVNGSTGTSFVRSDDGGQLAGFSADTPVQRVEILKAGKVVAMLPVNDTVVLPQAGIRLLPIKLPGTIVDRIDPVNMGDLTTTADCRKKLRAQYPYYYGTTSDDVLNDVCSGLRKEEKKDVKEQRITQKAQKEILRDLKKQGRQLMVFSDSTQLGAVVSGNFEPQRMHCRWKIEMGGSLRFEQAQTQIVRVGSDGACFNNLTGFQGNFDTNATATVELVYAYPAAAPGQFLEGGREISRADVNYKSIEEWVNR